jgi:hypothetical protein
MILDARHLGPQGHWRDDADANGARYAELRARLLADAYYRVWGAPDEPPLPTYAVTLGRALRGLPRYESRWRFQRAARRSVASRADWRAGPDGLGFRRLLHPNGVCLFGHWEIDPDARSRYSGYFQPGSQGLLIARYSTCCTETRGGRTRSLSLVGKLFPTLDPDERVETANFITQEDIGGSRTDSIDDAILLNAPNVSPWRRGGGLPVLLLTALVLRRADEEPTVRQLYPIAELGKPSGYAMWCPAFLRLRTEPSAELRAPGADFREEVLSRIYDRGDPRPKRKLRFSVEVADEGVRSGRLAVRRDIRGWERIGRLVFGEAVASYSGDFRIHFQHPPWRRNPNDPSTRVR